MDNKSYSVTWYIPPFDDEQIFNGNATIVTELTSQPDVIVCSVGGGGLLCGVLRGLVARGWTSTRVVAVETHGADSLYRAMEEKELVTLPQISRLFSLF